MRRHDDERLRASPRFGGALFRRGRADRWLAHVHLPLLAPDHCGNCDTSP
jgi:hypothetical protein